MMHWRLRISSYKFVTGNGEAGHLGSPKIYGMSGEVSKGKV